MGPLIQNSTTTATATATAAGSFLPLTPLSPSPSQKTDMPQHSLTSRFVSLTSMDHPPNPNTSFRVLVTASPPM